MTNAQFREFHAAMGYTYESGAAALGLTRAAYADYVSGISHNTGKPVVYKRWIALACAALKAGLEPLGTN